MPIPNKCIIDSSVLIKALFKPKKTGYGYQYQKDIATHAISRFLIRLIDDRGISVLFPRCGLLEVAGVAVRLSDPLKAEEIYREMEAVYTIIPEEILFPTAIRLSLEYGNPGLDNYFIASAVIHKAWLFTDDNKMHGISKKIGLNSFLIRDLEQEYITNLFSE